MRQDRGDAVDTVALEREAAAAIRHVVAKQLEVGIDVGNDGEMLRPGFATYVAGRMRGFGGESKRRLARDLVEHPDFEAMLAQRRRGAARIGDAPQCISELDYANLGPAGRECDLFLAATQAHPRMFADRFMTAASPGVIATILLSAHYDSHERYIAALAREMRKEYALIHSRGLVLQVDCPDLAMERARFFQDDSRRGFPPIGSACMCAGATTTGHTPTTFRSSRCCPISTGPAWARCRCRSPTRVTSTSTRC